jgi:hypothetical protein
MKVSKKETIKIKISFKEATKIRKEFGELKGVKDDMKIVELMERFDMAGVELTSFYFSL